MENNIQNQNFQEDEIKLSDYLRIILFYKWIIISIFAIVTTVTVFYTISLPDIYSATSKILIEDSASDDFLMFAGNNSKSNINNNLEIIKTYPLMEKAYNYLKNDNDFESYTLYEIEQTGEVDPISVLKEKISVSNKRETDLVTITCESTNPKEAKACVNVVARALQNVNTNYARREFTSIREFIESQLTTQRKLLRNSEEELRLYKLDKGVSILSEETSKVIEESSEISKKMQEAKTEYEVAYRQVSYLRGELGKQDTLLQDVDNILSLPFISKMKMEISETQTKIAKLLSKANYSKEHPQIKELSEELKLKKDNLNKRISRMISSNSGTANPMEYRSEILGKIAMAKIEAKVAESKMNSLSETKEMYERKMTLLPDTELQLARLTRDFKINEKSYTMLMERFQDARLKEQAKFGDVRIIESAKAPKNPIKPKKKMNVLIGLVLGLGLGVGTAFLIHSVDTKIRSMEDVETYVKLPILGTIPSIEIDHKKVEEIDKEVVDKTGAEKNKLICMKNDILGQLVTNFDLKSPISEAFRTLRTNIVSKKIANKPLSLIVTSAGPKIGKSTISSNISIAIAQMKEKTIIIDCDLRKPSLHAIFGEEKSNGISEYLAGSVDNLDSIITNTHIDHLDLITSGDIPANPSELLSSKRFKNLINDLKKKYQYIIIDSPPVIAVTDSMIIAKSIDHLLFGVRAEVSDRGFIKRAKELLGNVNIQITGAVVNGIDVTKYYNGYRNYYYYYHYYVDENVKS